MSSKAFERMRLQSHAHIKRRLELAQQRLRYLSGEVDKKRTCKYYAESAFLLCAVNPSGTCAECRDYAPKD